MSKVSPKTLVLVSATTESIRRSLINMLSIYFAVMMLASEILLYSMFLSFLCPSTFLLSSDYILFYVLHVSDILFIGV